MKHVIRYQSFLRNLISMVLISITIFSHSAWASPDFKRLQAIVEHYNADRSAERVVERLALSQDDREFLQSYLNGKRLPELLIVDDTVVISQDRNLVKIKIDSENQRGLIVNQVKISWALDKNVRDNFAAIEALIKAKRGASLWPLFVSEARAELVTVVVAVAAVGTVLFSFKEFVEAKNLRDDAANLTMARCLCAKDQVSAECKSAKARPSLGAALNSGQPPYSAQEYLEAFRKVYCHPNVSQWLRMHANYSGSSLTEGHFTRNCKLAGAAIQACTGAGAKEELEVKQLLFRSGNAGLFMNTQPPTGSKNQPSQ